MRDRLQKVKDLVDHPDAKDIDEWDDPDDGGLVGIRLRAAKKAVDELYTEIFDEMVD